MIEAIRKKHEKCKNFVRDSGYDENYYHSHLTVSDVDALFKELDEARGKVERIKGLIDKYESGEVSGFNTAVAISAIFYGVKGGGDE